MEQKDKVIIRQAEMTDINRVMQFLKKNWGEHHVMANSRELMCYEHAWEGEFTYILAEDEDTRKIYGVCGYLPYSDEPYRDMGAGIWKVIQSPHFLLGAEILKYVQEHTNCRMLACCGANPKTKAIRKKIGHFNGKLEQFYLLNDQMDEYRIAVIKMKHNITKQNDLSYKLVMINTIEQFKQYFEITRFKEILPYKDFNYIEHRYYKHIKYQYKILGIETDNGIEAVVIGRDIELNNRKIFRIVDYLGEENAFSGTYDAWKDFCKYGTYEYIDFYEFGLGDEILEAAGFVKRTDEDINIIPNYFEPFEQRNIDIYISSNVHQNFRMFKGDADQDRPNNM